MITIIDVNDNTPVFIHNEYKIEAVENWPEAMVLTRVYAEDKDKGLNADIRYSLSPEDNPCKFSGFTYRHYQLKT